MRIADTNVLLALIVDDRPRHAALVEAAIDPDTRPVLVTEAVLVEAASVLCWSYRYKRRAAAEALLGALSGPGIMAWDHGRAMRALDLMREDGALSLVDCLLIEQALDEGHELVTFDEHARKRGTTYVKL